MEKHFKYLRQLEETRENANTYCISSNSCKEPFYLYGETFISTWIISHMPRKKWDEITYISPIFNGATVEVWEMYK